MKVIHNSEVTSVAEKEVEPKIESTNGQEARDLTMSTVGPSREPNIAMKILKISNSYVADLNPGTCAEAILHEENANVCCVCEDQIEENYNRCSICTLACHNEYMDIGKGNEDMCLTCAANQSQRNAIQTDQEINGSLQEARSSFESKEMVSQQSESTYLLAETSLKESTNSVLAKATKGVKEKKSTQETAGVKQRELRQKELKLKKWEEELKVREVKTDELENDRRRLEDYLCKTEARNVELEATVRRLQRRISI